MSVLAVINTNGYVEEYDISNNISETEIDDENFPDELGRVLSYRMNSYPLRNLIWNMEPQPKGAFDEDLAYDNYCAQIAEYIDKEIRDFPVEIYKVHADGARELIKKVDLKPVFLKQIQDSLKEEDNQFAIHFVAYVEKCLRAYLEVSNWHLILEDGEKPILWFGPDEEYDDSFPWCIDCNDDVDLSFFFLKEMESSPDDDLCFQARDDFLNQIGLISDFWGTWYYSEGGHEIPDLPYVRERCPIDLELEDTTETILEKINQLTSGH